MFVAPPHATPSGDRSSNMTKRQAAVQLGKFLRFGRYLPLFL